MIRVIAIAALPLRMPSAMRTRAGHMVGAAGHFWRTRLARLTNRYHPEQHYMRGPGPKWREKHSDASLDSAH